MLFDASASTSTVTTDGASLANVNNKGGVELPSTDAKSNFPITQSILQNTDGVKKEQSFPNTMGFDNSKESMERLKKALREKAEQQDK